MSVTFTERSSPRPDKDIEEAIRFAEKHITIWAMSMAPDGTPYAIQMVTIREGLKELLLLRKKIRTEGES